MSLQLVCRIRGKRETGGQRGGPRAWVGGECGPFQSLFSKPDFVLRWCMEYDVRGQSKHENFVCACAQFHSQETLGESRKLHQLSTHTSNTPGNLSCPVLYNHTHPRLVLQCFSHFSWPSIHLHNCSLNATPVMPTHVL